MNLERCIIYLLEISFLSIEKLWFMFSVCLEVFLGIFLLYILSSLLVSLVECYDKEKCRMYDLLS